MPRKGPAGRRELLPDPLYRSVVVTQLVNKVLQRGKRSVAEEIVYDALTEIETKTGGDPIPTLKRAVENVRPALEVRSRRVGGATYQVPVEVRPRRATTLAIRWIVGYSRQRREKTMAERLAAELLDASNGLGAAIKRKDDLAEDGGVQQGVRPLPLVMRCHASDHLYASIGSAGRGTALTGARTTASGARPRRSPPEPLLPRLRSVGSSTRVSGHPASRAAARTRSSGPSSSLRAAGSRRRGWVTRRAPRTPLRGCLFEREAEKSRWQ